jgi:hypothetical protein
MEIVKAIECDLRDDGVVLTFNDGRTFFYSQSFLYATRFTHGNLVVPDKGPPNAREKVVSEADGSGDRDKTSESLLL